MTGQGSSLQDAGFFPREWTGFFAFLRSPQVPPMASGPGLAPLGATMLLYALDIVLMSALVGLAFIVTALGVEFPANDLEALDLDLPTVALLVLAAPLMEELGFRSWLSGRVGHGVALVALLTGLVALPVAQGLAGSPFPGILLAALALAMACFALWHWRDVPAARWYTRHFRWFFYASALAFALIHFSNYQSAGLIVLALVIPQGIAGLIFGYGRVQYGLWASILLHVMHNATAIGLVLAFESG